RGALWSLPQARRSQSSRSGELCQACAGMTREQGRASSPRRGPALRPGRAEGWTATWPRRRTVLLLAHLAALLALACTLAPLARAEGRCGSHPWCDTSLSPEARAKLLLGAMSQSDKVGILTGREASDVGMPPIKFTDGAVGAGGLGSGANSATAMPAAMALAANFDQSTATSYGAVVGQEVKH